MDLGNLFNSLDEDYKDIILAGAIGFPIAYLDCWKHHASFSAYDLFPQIMLTLGIDFIFIGACIMFCVFMWKAMKHNPEIPPYPEFNIFGMLVTFTITSAMVLVNAVKTPIKFEAYYLGYSFIFILFQYILDKVNHRRQIKQSHNKDNDNRDLNN